MIDKQYNAYNAKVDRSLALEENTAYDLENKVTDNNGMDVVNSEDKLESVNSMEEGLQNISQLSDHTYHKMEVANNKSELNACNEQNSETKTVELVQSNHRIVQGCESNERDPLQNVTTDIIENKSEYMK